MVQVLHNIMILPFLILAYLSREVFTQDLKSPCPFVFRYEPQTEKDRWYGVISARTVEDLTGVWLTIILDSKVELIGNWFGESYSSDNQEFRIANPDYILEAGPPVSVRFFVKYDQYRPTPRLQTIRLNGKTICSEDDDQIGPTTPKLHISGPGTPKPSIGTGFSYNSDRQSNTNKEATTINRPTQTNTFGEAEDNGYDTNRKPSRGSSSHNNKKPSSSSNEQSIGTDTGDTNTYYGQDSYSNNDSRQPSRGPGTHNYKKPPSGSNKQSIGTNTDDFDRTYGGSNSQEGGSDDYNPNVSTNKNGVTKRPPHNRQTQREVTVDHTSSRPSNTFSGSGHDTFGANSNDNSVQEGSNERYEGHSDRPSSSQNYGNSDRTTSRYKDNSDSEEDFFPGDFNVHKSTSNNSGSRPSPTALDSDRSVTCGTVAYRPRPLITNGQDTVPGEWPWHAAIYHTKGIQLVYICGGSLISDKFVLTAAHCVSRARTNKIVEPETILVYFGKYNLKTFGPETQDRDVSDIYIHPDYNYTTFYNDIAILKLNRPAKITDYVRPCCLWEGSTQFENIIGQQGTVIGWGFDENKKISEKLMQAKMPIVSTIQCIYSNRDFFARFTFDKNFCAGFRNGTSVCNGDSGGSLVFPRRGTSGQNTIWQIRGLVSVGVALQSEGVCDTSQYVIFTDVAKHLSWIQRTMES